MLKKVISIAVSAAVFLNTLSVMVYGDVDTTKYADTETSFDVLGEYDLHDREVVEVEENQTVTSDIDYNGTVNIAAGKKIIFDSGYISIGEKAVVNGDIEITGNASVNIYGTVNGCITVTSSAAPEYHENSDGTLTRQFNLMLGSSGLCDSIVIACSEGFVEIDGYVDSFTVLENAVCDIGIWNRAIIDMFSYSGTSSIGLSGTIAEFHMNSGNIGFSGAKIKKAYVENMADLYIDADSNISELYAVGENVSITNSGYIENLVCIGALFNNGGEIGNAFVKDSPSFVSYEDSDKTYSSSYIIANLLCENSSVDLSERGNASLSEGAKYGILTFNGGKSALYNTVAESVYAYGNIETIRLDNILINSIYFDFDLIQDSNRLDIKDPAKVFILNAVVTQQFYDSYYTVLSQIYDELIARYYGNEISGAEAEQIKDKFIIVTDRENEKISIPENITLSKGDTVKVSIENGYVPGAVSVSLPDGKIKFLTMDSGTFTADSDGNYSFDLYGGYCGCTVTAEKVQPLKTQINAYTGEYAWDINGESYISKNSVSTSLFDFSLYDVEDNKAINNFNIDRNGILSLSPEYQGRKLKLTAVHESVNWGNYWGFAPTETQFTAGAGTIEITALPYGQFSGSVNGSENFSIYIYNSDGKYYGKADSQDNAFWSSERFPNDTYQLVMINDPTNCYRFGKFSDFIRNGLISGSDFIQKEFVSVPGANEEFIIDSLPEVSAVQSPYIDYDKIAFNAHEQSAVQGAMVEFTLNYAFKDVEMISNAYAEIILPDGCESMGGIAAQDGILTLPLNLNENSVTFTVVSDVESDSIMLNASLRFDVDGGEEYAYIGSSGYSVVKLSMYAPDATGKPTVTLNGFATPGQTVVIYDGNHSIAQTESGSNGFWSCEATLSSAYTQYHDITAVLYDGTAKEIRTETKTVYNSSIVPVVEEFKFSYYVHGHSASVVLNGDEWGVKQWSYDYWPGSILTFEVKLTNSDNIEKMWITSNSDNRRYTLEGFYNEETESWIATGQFCDDESYMPGGFSVGWQLKENEVTSIINRVDQITDEKSDEEMWELTDEEISQISIPEEAVCDYSALSETAEGISGNVSVDLFGDGTLVADAQMTANDEPAGKTIDDYIAEGYTYDDASGIMYKEEYDENTDSYVYNIIAPPSARNDMMQMKAKASDPDQPLYSKQFLFMAEEKVPKVMLLNDSEDAENYVNYSILIEMATLEELSNKMIRDNVSAKDLKTKYISYSKAGFFAAGALISVLQCQYKCQQIKDRKAQLDILEQDFEAVFNKLLKASCTCYHDEVSCYCTTCPTAKKQALIEMIYAKEKLEALHTGLNKVLDNLMAIERSDTLTSTIVSCILPPFIAIGIDKIKREVFYVKDQQKTLDIIEDMEDEYQQIYTETLIHAGDALTVCDRCECDCITTTTTETSEIEDTSTISETEATTEQTEDTTTQTEGTSETTTDESNESGGGSDSESSEVSDDENSDSSDEQSSYEPSDISSSDEPSDISSSDEPSDISSSGEPSDISSSDESSDISSNSEFSDVSSSDEPSDTSTKIYESETDPITSASSSGGGGGASGGGSEGSNGKPSGEDGGNPNVPTVQPDPSGYVYEAVESNRITGVTAAVYYQDSDRSEVKWDAASTGQVNPQLTDNEGRYGWNVPFGFWKVIVEGRGYETMESEWMKVPPPRVDVNLAVTSLAPANVKRVNICEDFAEIEFDKYMDISTMDGIISIDGKSYDAVPVNEEISGLGDGRIFATVFRAELDTKAVNAQSYSIKVKSARCYANVVSKEYSGTVICAPIATALSANMPGEYAVSGSEITISAALETVGGYENIAEPQVTFDNPEMAQVVSIGNVDSRGKVDIVVKTAMAGIVNMNIKVPGSAVNEEIAIPVAREQDLQLKKALSAASGAAKFNVNAVTVTVAVLAAILLICIVTNIIAAIIKARKAKKQEAISKSM